MASPVAPVATLFGSTGGVSASGRPATKTAGQRRNVVDDDDAAVRLVSRRSNPTRQISPPPTFDLFETNPGARSRATTREPTSRTSLRRILDGESPRTRATVPRRSIDRIDARSPLPTRERTGLVGGGRDRGERREAARDGDGGAERRARRAAQTGQGGGRGRLDVQQTEARHAVRRSASITPHYVMRR